jgi:hypothetical protein
VVTGRAAIAFVAAVVGLGCAQIVGLSTHVAGDDGSAGALAGADGGAGAGGTAGGSVRDAAESADVASTMLAPGPMCGGPDAATCPTGLGDCHGTGCDVSLTSDQDNCGACGHSCRGGECQEGACRPLTIASNQHFESARQIAVSGAGVTWGTSDGFIQTLPFAAGAQPIMVAQGEGDVKDIVVDGEFAYVEADGPHCQYGNWCIRRISLVPGKYPATTLANVGNYSTRLALDAQALYLFSHDALLRVPTNTPGLPTMQELASNQGPRPTGVALDREYAYWGSNGDTEAIVKRLRLDGSDAAPQHLAAGLKQVDAVAVDDVNVYWTTGGAGRTVQMTPKQGGAPVITLATEETDAAVTIAVDDVNVYWGGGGGSFGFKKVPKCGGDKRQAAGGTSVFGIVPWMGNVYWNDSMSKILRVAQ